MPHSGHIPMDPASEIYRTVSIDIIVLLPSIGTAAYLYLFISSSIASFPNHCSCNLGLNHFHMEKARYTGQNSNH